MQNKDSSVTEMDSYMQALVCAECPILPQRLAMCLDACDMHMNMNMTCTCTCHMCEKRRDPDVKKGETPMHTSVAEVLE